MQPEDDPFAPNRRVLIVDDGALSRTFFLESLKANDYDTKAVESGEKGLEILQQFSPAVALVDYQMPNGMNGLEFLAQSREQAPLTQVVLVTGQGGEQVARQALTGGAFDYLKKPVSLLDLTTAVEKACVEYEVQTQKEFDEMLQRFFANGWAHYSNSLRAAAEGHVELMQLKLDNPNSTMDDIRAFFPQVQTSVGTLSAHVGDFGAALSGANSFYEVPVAAVFSQAVSQIENNPKFHSLPMEDTIDRELKLVTDPDVLQAAIRWVINDYQFVRVGDYHDFKRVKSRSFSVSIQPRKTQSESGAVITIQYNLPEKRAQTVMGETALGLNLANMMVKSLGGKMRYRSSDNGEAVYLWVPSRPEKLLEGGPSIG